MGENDRGARDSGAVGVGAGEDGFLRPVACVADVDDHAETVHLAEDLFAAGCHGAFVGAEDTVDDFGGLRPVVGVHY